MSGNPLPQLHWANVDFLTPQLTVGGDLDWNTAVALVQLEELTAAGVTHIIDTRIEADDAALIERYAEAAEVDLDYLHRGIDDAGQQVPAAWFDECVSHAVDAMDAGGVVLTHCHMGINRGPSLAYAVLLAQGWDPLEAIARILDVRPVVYVAYAEDALRWHHARGRSRESAHENERLAADLARLADWRRDNDLELVEVLRQTRPVDPAD